MGKRAHELPHPINRREALRRNGTILREDQELAITTEMKYSSLRATLLDLCAKNSACLEEFFTPEQFNNFCESLDSAYSNFLNGSENEETRLNLRNKLIEATILSKAIQTISFVENSSATGGLKERILNQTKTELQQGMVSFFAAENGGHLSNLPFVLSRIRGDRALSFQDDLFTTSNQYEPEELKPSEENIYSLEESIELSLKTLELLSSSLSELQKQSLSFNLLDQLKELVEEQRKLAKVRNSGDRIKLHTALTSLERKILRLETLFKQFYDPEKFGPELEAKKREAERMSDIDFRYREAKLLFQGQLRRTKDHKFLAFLQAIKDAFAKFEENLSKENGDSFLILVGALRQEVEIK